MTDKDLEMIFREAQTADIGQMHEVRMAVRENVLPDAGMITADDYADFLIERGKGWLCETENRVVGFAIVDLLERNVWALFVRPESEGKGVGKRLHSVMLDWYFSRAAEDIWLGTSPETRAAEFYRRQGWRETGRRSNGEIKFEITKSDWENRRG